MKMTKTIAAAILLSASLAVPAFAQHSGHGTNTADIQKMIEDMAPKPSDPPSTRAYKEAHMNMMMAMHVTFSGDADKDFVRGMIPHHQGAIDMAQVELAHGKDPALKAMAQKIIDDQKKEIGQMRDWQKKNGK